LLSAAGMGAAEAEEYFVAPNGHDANPGTKAKPFLTLEAARDAVRSLKEKGNSPSGGVTIWIRGGTYPRQKPFELTAADSGTKDFPVVYRAYQDEEPRLLGGQLLKGFKPESDAAILDRLSEDARKHIFEADLPSQGILDFGELRSRGFGRPISPSHLELFFEGQPMTLARWPNEGKWEKIAGFPEDSAQDDGHGGKIGALESGFFYEGDRPRRWKNFEDVWVHGFWAWDWANSYEKIEGLDFKKRWIKTGPPRGHYGFRVGQRAVHNLIHDHPHCPILYSGNDHRIEWDEIHHVALETGDVGAIYAGRDWTFRGNAIGYNFIHHTGGVGMGSMGVYMDDCVSGTEIFGNIFYRVKRAVFLGGGRDYRVENNIFVECHPAVEIDGRGLDKSPVWSNMVYQFMKQQLMAVPQELYRSRYRAIADLDRYYQTAEEVPPENNRVARNICSGGEWLKVGWHADPRLIQVHDNFVKNDPGFISVEKMDFRLKKGAPALASGFVPIPAEKIGLYRDEFRRR